MAKAASEDEIARLRTEYEGRLAAEKKVPEQTVEVAAPPPAGNSIGRSAAGLRDHLFDVLEKLRDGALDPKKAAVAATVAQAILKSVDIQLTFEKLKLDSEIPMNLSDMKLVPPIAMLPSGVNK